ncbi:hypothetical protein BU24DRAFT_435970 [Aaosphaeria arxii CBS 175.79]|uniref:C3H1-type domain-containing protein n=1 Tax=Aaosphaeria arxii CBS 175.79 TaxID=1450172 RepID=A0A6A5XFE1_9PLEO|nr:uncharacterized protein BU24DRAFT_435970 [Aaosphaeria arxii CBS 175.79]KAF2011566.1 hypothetical protein BU24DRAFT_435970 [Aaosphaeria arxii CBS 175.79]
MAPSTPYSNGTSPESKAFTPSRVRTPSEQQDDTSVWSRAQQLLKLDQAKSDFINELVARYEYLKQSYESEIKRNEECTQAWQFEKLQYETHLKSFKIALDRDPFVTVLIDGDGMIFKDELVRQGEPGGRKAAAQLHAAILNYVQHETETIPTNVQIICRVYANVRGLAEVLVRTGVVEDIETVEQFTRGFTRGNSLFDFVDVGPGKDRADTKIIETFKLYLGDFHCRQIFFGCSHDNGYARTLEAHASDPVAVPRVTLLEGVPFEKELVDLPYKTKKFSDLFRDTKLSTAWGASSSGYNSIPNSPAPVKNYNVIGGLPTRFPPPQRQTSNSNSLLDSPNMAHVVPTLPRTPSTSTLASTDGISSAKPVGMNWAAKAAAPAPPTTADSPVYRPVSRGEIIARNRAGQRVDPPSRDYDKVEVDRIKRIKMCNVHFLRDECPFGDNCTHLHAYKPTPSEISTLRLVARMAPCSNGSGCEDIKCIYGHRCPAPTGKTATSGKTCIFGENCKFPPELHNVDCNIVKTLVIR